MIEFKIEENMFYNSIYNQYRAKRRMSILIACEESQTVCKAFRSLGHSAYSCDILPCSGGHTEWHIMENVLRIVNGSTMFTTSDGTHHRICGEWDMIIAHPPGTYLTVSGNRWFDIEKYGENAIIRRRNRERAIEFFMKIAHAHCGRIAIENPVGVISTVWRKPEQIIEPYMFGEHYEKKTCLWLKGLPTLKATNRVTTEERIKYKTGHSLPKWYAETWNLSKEERQRVRSKTFDGIAKAMAEQWGGTIEC